MTDLNAIRSRLDALMRHAGGTDYAGQVIADSIALVAEVERLQQMQPKRNYYASLGAAQERAAVVAWLRDCALDPETTGAEMRLLQDQATMIERGEHRRKDK